MSDLTAEEIKAIEHAMAVSGEFAARERHANKRTLAATPMIDWTYEQYGEFIETAITAYQEKLRALAHGENIPF